MSAAPALTAADRAQARPRPVRAAGLLGAVAGGVLLGLVLTQVGDRAGAPVVLGLLVAVALGLAAVRRPDLTVVAFVVSLGAGPVVLGPVELVQVTSVLTVAAVLGPAALRLGVRLPAWPILAPMVAFVVLAVLSSAAAPDPEVAFNLIVQLVVLVLVTLAVVTALPRIEAVRRFVVGLVAAGGLLAAYALLTAGPTETYYAGAVVTGRAVGLFSQPNELGMVCAALLVLATGVGLTQSGRAVRAVAAVSGLLLLVGLGLSLSRGAWLGAVGGLVVLALLCRPARRPLGVLAGAAVAAVALLAAVGVGFAQEVVSRLLSLGDAGSDPYDQRGLIWAAALRLIPERPLTGYGPGGYTRPASAEALRDGAFVDVEHAHNLLLNVAVEYGLLGVVALLALVVGLLLCAAAARRALLSAQAADPHAGGRGDAALPGIVVAALSAVVVHTVVDFPLRNATCITVVWLLVSLVAVLHRVDPDGRNAETAESPHRRRKSPA